MFADSSQRCGLLEEWRKISRAAIDRGICRTQIRAPHGFLRHDIACKRGVDLESCAFIRVGDALFRGVESFVECREFFRGFAFNRHRAAHAHVAVTVGRGRLLHRVFENLLSSRRNFTHLATHRLERTNRCFVPRAQRCVDHRTRCGGDGRVIDDAHEVDRVRTGLAAKQSRAYARTTRSFDCIDARGLGSGANFVEHRFFGGCDGSDECVGISIPSC